MQRSGQKASAYGSTPAWRGENALRFRRSYVPAGCLRASGVRSRRRRLTSLLDLQSHWLLARTYRGWPAPAGGGGRVCRWAGWGVCPPPAPAPVPPPPPAASLHAAATPPHSPPPRASTPHTPPTISPLPPRSSSLP